MRRIILPNERLEGNNKHPRWAAFRKTVKRVRAGPCYPRDIYLDQKLGLSKDTIKHNLKLGLHIGIFKKLEDGRYAWIDYEPPHEHILKQKYGASEIVYRIEILKDKNRSRDSKISAGEKLRKYCSHDGEIEGGKKELRSFFIETLDKFESNEGLEFNKIYLALENYMAFQLKGEEDILWVKKVYPKLSSLFNNISSIEGRKRILKILEEIYRTNELYEQQHKLTELLREKFFDPKEDDSIVMHCFDILWLRADDVKKVLKDEIYNLAKSWEKFWCLADDDLKKMLKDVNLNIKKSRTRTKSDEEILKKRMEKVIEKYDI